MYQDFFSLNQQPFSIAPDPDFLFFTEQHKEALAHLTYGLQGNGGFVVLTGEVGTGKTSVCQFLLQDMPADTDIASINNPHASEIDLLVDICDQFSIEYDRENISLKIMFDALASWMLANHQLGRHAIVLIDEAQHLSFNVLEQLRLITNIEADNLKPLQIILIGQTALQTKLLTNELRQLSQRITARYHLRALNNQECNFYINHRLNIAGAKGPIFSPKSTNAIFEASLGIPRLINQICDRCLLSAYTQSSIVVTPSITKRVISETDLPERKGRLTAYIPHSIALVAMLLVAFVVNGQMATIRGYFNDPELQTMKQEWLDVLTNATQDSPEKANDALTAKIASPIITPQPTDLVIAQQETDLLDKVSPIEPTPVVTELQAEQITSLVVNSQESTADITPLETAPQELDLTVNDEKIVAAVESASSAKLSVTEQLPTDSSLTPHSELLAEPSDHYTVQLAALLNKKLVNKFFAIYPQLKEQTYLYRTNSVEAPRYVILMGNFKSYKKAKLATKELTKQYPNIKPWIKDYRMIQGDIQ